MKLLISLLALCSFLCADIVDELIEMGRCDQEVRWEVIYAEREYHCVDPDLQAAVEAIDVANTERLKEIIAQQGWPTISSVGAPAANAAWLIAQHAVHDPQFMEEVLVLIEPLVSTGDVHPGWFALLADRTRVLRGEPQLYGSQYLSEWVDGHLQLTSSTPIIDPDRLDERRAELGLCPHAEYLRGLTEMITGQGVQE